MKDGLKFIYDPKVESFVDAVCNAYASYIRINKAFPKQIIISNSEAGYQTPLMDVHPDGQLPRGTFWLGV